MSQQNKQTKKLIIGFIIFSLICILVTIIAIIHKNYKLQQNKTNISEKNVEQMQIKSLIERYKENDIKVIEEEQHIGASREAQWENDHNITKLNFYYIQIKGLKNKEIEEKINAEIKQVATSWYTNEELHDDNIDYISINVYVLGNYGNALSIRIDKYIGEFIDSKYEEKSLNYNLVTGEKVKFAELFLPGTSIKNIISQVVYDYYISEEGYRGENDGDLSKADLSKIENKVYEIMRIYNQNPNIEHFNFTCGEVLFSIGDLENAYIDMWKFYDKIAIYKRFLMSESIFDGKYSNDNTSFVFMGVNDYFIDKKIKDNLYEYIALNIQEEKIAEDKYKKIYDEFLSIIDNEIDKQKIEAEQNPETTTIIIGYFSLYDTYFNDDLVPYLLNNTICEYSKNIAIVKMPTNYFKNELFNYLYSINEDLMSLTYEKIEKVKVDIKYNELNRIDINTKRKIKDIFEDLLKEKFENINQDKSKQDLDFVINEIDEYSSMLSVIQRDYAIFLDENEQKEFKKVLDNYYDKLYELFEWSWSEQEKENKQYIEDESFDEIENNEKQNDNNTVTNSTNVLENAVIVTNIINTTNSTISNSIKVIN